MNGLFLDQKFRKVIKDTSIKLIKDNSVASIESFEIENELFLNLDRYVDDIIDYLNNSDIEKLIFKKDLKHLDLIYDEKERLYILVGKRKIPICKLNIADLEWTYKYIYTQSRDRYAGNVYITYNSKNIKNRESYKLKKIRKKSKLIFKMLSNIFCIEDLHTYMIFFINYRKSVNLVFNMCILDKKYEIDFNSSSECSEIYRPVFNIMKEDISMLWGIETLKDFKNIIKVIKSTNEDLKSKLNDTFNGICFKNRDENLEFIFSPFIEFSEKSFHFKVNITNADLSDISEDKLCILNNYTYEVTDFTLGEYIDNKNEVLENIRLLMY